MDVYFKRFSFSFPFLYALVFKLHLLQNVTVIQTDSDISFLDIDHIHVNPKCVNTRKPEIENFYKISILFDLYRRKEKITL